MNIAVCVKRVPDMELRFSIGADRRSLDQAGLKFDLSDFDCYALEVALQLAEKRAGSEVVLISVGPDGVQETLRKGLAMGATRAIQLKADEVPVDGFAVAQALAAELKTGTYDLILFGRMATDTASGTVGPMVAELLGLPCVSAISHLDIADGRGTARRDLEGAAETVEFPLPAVLSIDEGIARARLATLKGIMAAKKKPLETRPAALGQVRLTVEAMALPAERSGPKFVGQGADAVPELVQRLRTEAKVL
ncbi:MAG TPA: electron transfer flavoprotein subunit beta/FixA family protein [Gemmatimonadales bacterium]|nr:electron transfer flavoprotein subunit beta/FixA family protein [Gemmatimonadales bacterium]